MLSMLKSAVKFVISSMNLKTFLLISCLKCDLLSSSELYSFTKVSFDLYFALKHSPFSQFDFATLD